MHYLDNDIAYLFRRGPYLQLAKPRSAGRLLTAQLQVGRELRVLLERYPSELYEPLEFFYSCLFAHGALNAEVLEDLIQMLGWRGLVWGCHLTFLDPKPQYLDILRQIELDLPYNQWLVDLVLADAEGEPVKPEHQQVAARMRELRALLSPIPRPTVKLRRAPSAAQLAHMARERAYIKELYQTCGTSAALGAVRGTMHAYYNQTYRAWGKRGFRPPPPIEALIVPPALHRPSSS